MQQVATPNGVPLVKTFDASNPDYAPFLAPAFSASEYANSVLSGENAQDISSPLAKLNGGIDELNRQLRLEVS